MRVKQGSVSLKINIRSRRYVNRSDCQSDGREIDTDCEKTRNRNRSQGGEIVDGMNFRTSIEVSPQPSVQSWWSV